MNAARLAAARALLSLDRGRTTLMAESERERSDIADLRDRALFLEITAGTMRWRGEIDACITTASRRSMDDLMPEVRAVLRSGAYQLLHLDRVPPHAAVSESVEVVRAMGKPKAAGLVNAVLRRIAGRDARRRLPPRPAEPRSAKAALDYLSITLSHPRWLVQRWLDRYGFEATERWCLFNNAPPHISVRPAAAVPSDVLRDQLRAVDIAAAPSRFVERVVNLAPGGLGRLDVALRESLIVQDEGSLLVALAAGVMEGETVLDACAAPGGKTMVFAEAVGARGRVIASDVRPGRVTTLRTQLQRTAPHVPILALDVSSPLPFEAVFDRVILDAPCSGLGTLRRDPDIKWSRQESDLEAFADAQSKMLDQAAAVVRPGGRLIYATCSSEPEENARAVDAFLARTPAFTVEPIGAIGSGLVSPRGFLETVPFRDELDAFFAAKLVRSGVA